MFEEAANFQSKILTKTIFYSLLLVIKKQLV